MLNGFHQNNGKKQIVVLYIPPLQYILISQRNFIPDLISKRSSHNRPSLIHHSILVIMKNEKIATRQMKMRGSDYWRDYT